MVVDERAELARQIRDGLRSADFALQDRDQLIKSFPLGADTTYSAGNTEIRIGDAVRVFREADFPLVNADQVADIMLDRYLQ